MGTRHAGRPAQLGADDVIRFLDTEHFLRELAGNLGRGRAFVRTRRSFELQDALGVEIEAPGVSWKVKAEAVVVFARDGFVGLEFENFEQAVLPELDRLGMDAERAKLPARSEQTVIAPVPSFESSDVPRRTGEAEVYITEDDDASSSHIQIRPMPSIPDPAETEADQPLRIPQDRGTTIVEEAEPEGTLDLPDGTQDLSLYERHIRTRRPRNVSEPSDRPPPDPRAFDVSDADATHDGTPVAASPPEPDTDSNLDALPPAIPAEGLEVFEDRARRFLRATPGGVLKLSDEADLLGLYLSQIRHGWLMAIGGPDGAIGDTVRIKIAAGRVVTAEAQILSRVAGIVTLGIADEAPFRELLTEKKDALLSALEGIVGSVAPSAAAPAPSAPDLPRPVEAAPAAPEPPPQPAAAPESPPPADEGPPRTPKLEGNVVRFARVKDLAQELKANLSNGGLFVESGPLPLRSKRRFQIAIGNADLGCPIDAEVVFADGGRVGLMVARVQEVLPKLQQIVDSGVVPEEEEGSSDIDEKSLAEAAKSSAGEQGVSFGGKLDAPLTMGRILEFQFRRIENEAELEETTVLQLFEFLVRKELRGALDIESDDKRKLTVWLHEGSVAFVILKPSDENHALGRILINMKRLNESALRQGLETSQKTKKSLGRTLVALGLIKKPDLSAALREQTRLVMSSAFGFTGGRFDWGPWREPPGEADLVLTKGQNVLTHYLRHRYEALGSGELEVLFGKNMGRRVTAVVDLDRIAGPMALQPKELRFLQLQCDGSRPISDAVLGSPIGRLASLRLVGVLLSMGQLRFTDGQHHVVRENTSLAKEPSAFVRIKKELNERLALFRGMNHFEVLGVHWSAHHRGHRAAYEKVTREFDLKRAPLRDAPDEVKAIAKEILTIIENAWSVLSNAESRQSYRKQMFDKTERQYAADMLVKQGEVSLMRGDRVAAIEALETAVELDPSNRNRTLLATAREGRR